MGLFNRLSQRADLMGRMFQQTGADLAMIGDATGENAIRNAIGRCMSCASEDQCRAWLDTADDGAAPPAFCRNAHFIDSLTGRAKIA